MIDIAVPTTSPMLTSVLVSVVEEVDGVDDLGLRAGVLCVYTY